MTTGLGGFDLESFARRGFRCHRCGATGVERQETDRAPGSVRYRFGADTVLLPCCARCTSGLAEAQAAVARMIGDVESGDVPWVFPEPLPTYRCSVPACRRLWHHLGSPLPLDVVDDEASGTLGRHPCPWCTALDPGTATAAHRALARGDRPPEP